MIRAKKSLGQNFLIDKNISNFIVDKCDIKKTDTVLEIGPGTGNLSEVIIKKKPFKIILIEKDNILSNNLNEKFKNEITLIKDDVLNIINENIEYKNLIVVGNLPYNISSQILVRWIRLSNLRNICKSLIFMFQKEMADRIIAKHNEKKYGRISILASWKFDIEKLKDINPKSFFPSPKVNSTLLMFKPKKKFFELSNPKNLEHVTNIFFNQRRKMIKKPLNILFKNADEIAQKLSIKTSLRPQNLKPETYFKLCKEYEKLAK